MVDISFKISHGKDNVILIIVVVPLQCTSNKNKFNRIASERFITGDGE